MGNLIGSTKCSRCGSPFLEGEMVGVQDRDGRTKVLCCLCLDLNTSRLCIIRRSRGRLEIHEPRAAAITRRPIRSA
jgi:hypothetical protein